MGTLKALLLKAPLIRNHRFRVEVKANVVAPVLRALRGSTGGHRTLPASLRRFKHGNRETFFGYYEIPSVDKEGTRILAHAGPEGPVQPVRRTLAEYGYFRLDQDNTFVSLGETTTWCWQMGARLRWLPGSDYSTIAVNKPVNDAPGSVFQDAESGAVVRSFDRALYDIGSPGDIGLSLNFARLAELRPGYGYDDFTDPHKGVSAPADDGVWTVNLNTGQSDLIVSLGDLASLGDLTLGPDVQHYVNHLSFNPSASRIFFLHLWDSPSGRTNSRGARVVTCNPNGGDIFTYTLSGTPSHYYWMDDQRLVVSYLGFGQFPSGYYLVDDSLITVEPFWSHLPTVDGHQSLSSDGSLLLTDKHPDRYYEQVIQVFTDQQLLHEFGPFIPSARYSGPTRCDLHPRWNASGRFVAFDSTHDRGRAVYLIDLHAI
jgi:hypothetical protein